MYTIKHAAQQVGIATATLRAWERRYGVVSPTRTDSGYRVYAEHDVEILHSMKQLMDQGWQPGLAAQEALRRAVHTDPNTSQAAAPVRNQPRPSPALDTHALGSDLIAAAAALDTGEVTAVLDQLFALNSFETVMTRHVFPALEDLGEAWSDGRVSVAGEHLSSHAVMRRLAVAYEAAAAYGHGPRVALGMAPGSRHEIGLLAFAVSARRHGISTDYLGADLPLDDWLSIVDHRDLAAVVLAVPTTADIDGTRAVIGALQERRPGLIVAVGGAEQEQSPPGALRLGHDLVAGVETLTSAISAARSRPVPSDQSKPR